MMGCLSANQILLPTESSWRNPGKSSSLCAQYYLPRGKGKLNREGEWETMTNFISTKSWMPGDLLNQLLPSAPGYHRRPRSDCISVDYVVLIQQWVRFVKEGGQSKREKTSVTSSELSLLKNISFLVTTCSFDPLIFYSGYRAFSTPPLFPLCVCKTVIMPEPQKERLHFASTCFWR